MVGIKQKTISAIEKNPENVRLSTLFRVLSTLEIDMRLLAKHETNLTHSQWSDEW